jgi:uracil-DNA glycosylase family 4
MLRVAPVGPKPAKVMIVGESPGREEALSGIPFVGSAGKQLDRMLLAAGLNRSEIYITNVVKTLPPSDKEDFFMQGKVPTATYMAGILDLIGEIKEVQPNVVVPLGNWALWALTQHTGVTKWRGSILESKLGVKVIPTLHPAFLIRGMMHKEPLVIWDLQKAARESAFPEVRPPKANFILDPSRQDIDEAVERLLRADLITGDTEWFSPENLACIGFTDSKDWAICIRNTSMHAHRALQEILASPVPKVWQNGMFDAVALSRAGFDVRNVKHDTMVAMNACWGDLGEKGLRTIASVYTDWPYYKDDIEFLQSNDPRAWEYNCKDVVVTHEAMERFLKDEFSYTKGGRGYEISMLLMEPLIEGTNLGLRCDRQKLVDMRAQLLANAEHMSKTLDEVIGYSINVKSPKQVAELVYDRLKVKSDKRSTAQEDLMDIAAATDRADLKLILTTILRIRKNRDMCSRYLTEDIIDRDGRVRCNWNLAGTRNGRLSTTQPWWNGVALQTFPGWQLGLKIDPRCVIVADPGCLFVGADYEQAEARVVAAKTRDFELLEDMDSGIDIHTKLAAMLPFGKSYKELMDLIKLKGKDQVGERVIAKKGRHSLNYVGTWMTLKSTVNKDFLDTGIGINAATSKAIVNAYYNLHSSLRLWHKDVRSRLYRDSYLENCFGRRRRFLGMLDDRMLRDAVAFEPQSTIADLTTISMAEAKRRMPWAVMLLHMHDGCLFQVPEDKKDEALAILREAMTREIKIDSMRMTIPVETKWGLNWADLHSD